MTGTSGEQSGCLAYPKVQSPVSIDAFVVVDAQGNDTAYLRAVMERERDGTRVTVTEEMIVRNDDVKQWQRRAETEHGEVIARQQTLR